MGFPHGNADQTGKCFSVYLQLTEDWAKGKQSFEFPEASAKFVIRPTEKTAKAIVKCACGSWLPV